MAGKDNVPSAEDFVRAFDKQRITLAGFSRCSNLEELLIVRDGFYLGLAKDLCPDKYKQVLVMVLRKRFGDENHDTGVVEGGKHGMMSLSFEEMVLAARVCDETKENEKGDDHSQDSQTKQCEALPTTNDKDSDASSNDTPNALQNTTTTYWKDLVQEVLEIAKAVGSDLESIWKTLQDGRMNWLRAVQGAHPIKVLLQKALGSDPLEGDVSDAMMVWIYAICVGLVASETEIEDEKSQLAKAVEDWGVAVNMTHKDQPLKGYQAELWDPRKEEWRPLDVGAQKAAEAGGTTLLDAWKAK